MLHQPTSGTTSRLDFIATLFLVSLSFKSLASCQCSTIPGAGHFVTSQQQKVTFSHQGAIDAVDNDEKLWEPAIIR